MSAKNFWKTLNPIQHSFFLLSATNSLREDHKQIRRLDKVIIKCYTQLYAGKNIPISDLEKITIIIEEFFDSIHYSREEEKWMLYWI